MIATLQIRSLTDVSLAELTATFNEAFSDYFIHLQFTEAGMAEKLKAEGVQPAYSAGAFDGDRLVGFILHGYDVIDGVKTIYNGGTGVIPSYRNQGITTAMYQYSILLLQKEGICKHVLEVIDTNQPAIAVYEKIGFVKQRHLSAFKSANAIVSNNSVQIRDVDSVPNDNAFTSMRPAWQNATASIERARERHRILGAYVNNELVGYAVDIPATGRVNQCAVHTDHRRSGIGRALLAHISQTGNNQPLTITNVDDAYQPARCFLEAIGFQPLLGLYEMELDVAM